MDRAGRRRKRYSLKERILIIFTVIIAACAVCMTVIAQHTISRFINSNVENAYQDMASSILNGCESVMDNLELLSQQLGFGVVTSEKLLDAVNQELPAYDRVELQKQLQEDVRVLSFTNSNVGLVIYDDGEEVLFDNYPVTDLKDLTQPSPLLYQSKEISCYGPRKSLTAFIGEDVLMLRRRISGPADAPLYLTIETNFNTLKRIFPEENPLIFTDREGVITYSSDPQLAKAGGRWENSASYKAFPIASDRGFSLIVLVDLNEIKGAQRQAYLMLLVVLGVFAAVLAVLAWLLWRTVYKPLRLFDEQLDGFLMEDGQQKAKVSTGMEEYDRLLERMGEMKGQIREMIAEIISHEEDKNRMQLEKLRYQINPHFLMNTLNTVHWMAVINSEQEIDRVIQALNRLLFYNLDKDGDNTDIERELSAIGEYMLLQKVRYDFTYRVSRRPEGAVFHYATPKFILQPIIENSLSHGYRENMHIEITVEDQEDMVCIRIEDDGVGIPEDKLASLDVRIASICEDASHYEANAMGIGLEYVIQSLTAFYEKRGKRAGFELMAGRNGGTAVHMRIPKIDSGYDPDKLMQTAGRSPENSCRQER